MADRIKGITVEINGDATGLSNALKGINSSISQTRTALNDVNRLLKLDPKNTELLEQKQKILASVIEETKKKLDTLKEAEKDAQKQFAEGKISEEQYNALKREIIDTEQKLKSLEQQTQKTGKSMGDFLKDAGEGWQKTGEKVTKAGENFTKAFTVPIVGIGKASADAWKEIDAGLDTIIVKTGASGDALEEMQGIMKDLAVSIPTDFKTAGDAVGEVNTRFGSMGEELKDLSDYFIRFAELNETDVSQSVDSVQASMEAFNLDAKDAKNVLDTLNKAGQDTGMSVLELSKEITKNSQKMKDLGFSYSDAAFFLANLSKNGMDTSTVMSGLSKAQANAAKNGKTLQDSLKDLQKKLKDAGTKAEATQEIMELFGAKAGTQLADALQTGRLSFDEFGESLDAFAGNVASTFEAVQDPPDRLKVAMNALKVSGAELVDSVLMSMAPMLEDLIGLIKTLTEKFSGLSDGQKQAIVFTAGIVAALGPLIIILGSLISSIGSIISFTGSALSVGSKLIGVLTGTGEAAGAAGGALAFLAGPGGPVLLAVAAVGALAAAFAKTSAETKEYEQALAELDGAEQSHVRSAEELKKSYEDLDAPRKAAIDDADFEARRQRDLWNELQQITDENGKIKEGYEERAAVITGQLSEALGTEISITDGVIRKYGELQQSIDDVIRKKEAEALLEANRDAYTEALKRQTGAYTTYRDLQKDVAQTQNELAAASASLENEQILAARAQELNNEGQRQYAVVAAEASERAREQQAIIEGLRTQLEQQQAALGAAGEAMTGYAATIQNQEALMAATVTGDEAQIQAAIDATKNSLITAETGNRETLQRQLENYRTHYENVKAAVEEGAPGVTQAQVDEAARMIERAQAELDKLPEAFSGATEKAAEAVVQSGEGMQQAGEAAGQNYTAGEVSGIEAGTENVVNAARTASERAVEASAAGLGVNSPSIIAHEQGVNWDEGLAGGIAEGAEQIFTAVDAVAEGVAGRMSSALEASTAQVTSYQASTSASWSGWSQSLLATLTTTFTQMTATTTSGMTKARQTIETNLQQIRTKWEEQWKAIQEKHRQATDAIRQTTQTSMTEIRTTIETEMTAAADLHKSKMDEMQKTTEESMTAMLESVKTKAAEFKPALESGIEPGVQYLKDLIPMARTWGTDFMNNYIAAMREKLDDLKEVCSEAADIVSDYLECSRPDKGAMHTYPIWGKDFMEGYAESLTGNSWRVMDAVAGLTEKMQQTMAGNNEAGRPLILTTKSQTILDGKVLAETVNEELGVVL